MSFSQHLQDRLVEYQLDPIYVEDIVTRTIEEDLAGGIDITSQATTPALRVRNSAILI